MIIGGALGTVVNSLVNDIIMPPIGFALGGVDFSTLKIVLKAAVGGDPATEVAIRWGAFINAIIAFIVDRLRGLADQQDVHQGRPAAEVKTCPFCKEANAVDASSARPAPAPSEHRSLTAPPDDAVGPPAASTSFRGAD